ncbi:MAG: 4-hydroxy-3-methylbut-2-enyl diphosphate reductase [Arcanobacterium sp.]|nr:4-hydroxy-3-methylbut-2-enyl diphosphate reductase [Arcanobacterium sp.]
MTEANKVNITLSELLKTDLKRGESLEDSQVSLAGASAFPSEVPSEPSAEGKKLLLATPRGYCAGVDRAVDAVEKALELYGAPVYVRKEIVHNKFVVETLTKRGAIFVNETEDVPEGARVVFSAHGVSPAVHEQAAVRQLQTIDATCPLVTKVHKQAVRFANEDYDILLIGHEGHEEVEGTQGEAPNHIQVVNGPEDVASVEVRDPSKVIWISQTTLSVDETMKTVELLRQRFPEMSDPPSDDICYATQNRQGAVKAMAPKADVVIVVGSANSSNSVRLVEVALEAGAGAAYRVDKAAELDLTWISGAKTVGLTSGASVPEILVREVVDLLKSEGFTEVENIATAQEDVRFSLPKNLRADLKATGADVDRPHKPREKGIKVSNARGQNNAGQKTATD